jgi:hypothetical protein
LGRRGLVGLLLGHWIFAWDEALWILGFMAIGMNLSEWRKEIDEETESGASCGHPLRLPVQRSQKSRVGYRCRTAFRRWRLPRPRMLPERLVPMVHSAILRWTQLLVVVDLGPDLAAQGLVSTMAKAILAFTAGDHMAEVM